MSSDLDARLLDAALASIRAGKPFADVFGEVLGLAGTEMPSPAWDALAATDTATDVAKGTAWVQRQFEERPQPDDMTWLWFGLYMVRSASPGRLDAMVGLSGGPAIPEPDWTITRSWDAAGYAPGPGLRALLSLAAGEEPDLRAVVAGPVVFAYSLALVAAILDCVGVQLLDGRPQLGVVVGVPGGQTVELGLLTPAGLDRSGVRRLEPAGPADQDAPPA